MSPLQLLDSLSQRGPTYGHWVHAHLYQAGRDHLLWLEGGQAHVGAVSLGPAGQLVIPPHEEGPLAQALYQALAPHLPQTLLLVAGIHFDGLTPPEIAEIQATALDLGQAWSQRLQAGLAAQGWRE